MVYYGILWYILVYYSILWYIIVYYSILWYVMVCYGSIRSFRPRILHCDFERFKGFRGRRVQGLVFFFSRHFSLNMTWEFPEEREPLCIPRCYHLYYRYPELPETPESKSRQWHTPNARPVWRPQRLARRRQRSELLGPWYQEALGCC